MAGAGGGRGRGSSFSASPRGKDAARGGRGGAASSHDAQGDWRTHRMPITGTSASASKNGRQSSLRSAGRGGGNAPVSRKLQGVKRPSRATSKCAKRPAAAGAEKLITKVVNDEAREAAEEQAMDAAGGGGSLPSRTEPRRASRSDPEEEVDSDAEAASAVEVADEYAVEEKGEYPPAAANREGQRKRDREPPPRHQEKPEEDEPDVEEVPQTAEDQEAVVLPELLKRRRNPRRKTPKISVLDYGPQSGDELYVLGQKRTVHGKEGVQEPRSGLPPRRHSDGCAPRLRSRSPERHDDADEYDEKDDGETPQVVTSSAPPAVPTQQCPKIASALHQEVPLSPTTAKKVATRSSTGASAKALTSDKQYALHDISQRKSKDKASRSLKDNAVIVVDGVDSDVNDAPRPSFLPSQPYVAEVKSHTRRVDTSGGSLRRSMRQGLRTGRFVEGQGGYSTAPLNGDAGLQEAEKVSKETESARQLALKDARRERDEDQQRTEYELEKAKRAQLPTRELFLYPPGDFRGRVAITSDDRARLNPERYLNDSLIDFYIKHIDRVLAPRMLLESEPMFCFSSFFFGRLRQEVNPIDYKGVQRWTKYANDLFSKRYIFVPVCDSHHWSLIVVANLDKLELCIENGGEWEGEHVDRPSVLYIDSLSGGARGHAFASIMKKYLAEEWLSRKEKEPLDLARKKLIRKHVDTIIRVVKPRVPMQTNEFDCGLYLLWNMVEFLRNRDGFRERCLDRKGASEHGFQSLGRYYSHSAVLELRGRLKSLVEFFTPADKKAEMEKDQEEANARVAKFESENVRPGGTAADNKVIDTVEKESGDTADVFANSRRTAEAEDDLYVARALKASQEEQAIGFEITQPTPETERGSSLAGIEDDVVSGKVSPGGNVYRRSDDTGAKSAHARDEKGEAEVEKDEVEVVRQDMSEEHMDEEKSALAYAAQMVAAEAPQMKAVPMTRAMDEDDDFITPMAGKSPIRASPHEMVHSEDAVPRAIEQPPCHRLPSSGTRRLSSRVPTPSATPTGGSAPMEVPPADAACLPDTDVRGMCVDSTGDGGGDGGEPMDDSASLDDDAMDTSVKDVSAETDQDKMCL